MFSIALFTVTWH